MATKISCDKCGKKILDSARSMIIGHGILSFNVETFGIKDFCRTCFLELLIKTAQTAMSEEEPESQQEKK